MSAEETEWTLQARLTRSWLQPEPTVVDGEELFLAAWELMTDFRINDSRRQWNLPSVDFVFLDRAGHMVLVELKRKIVTPRDSWSVVCQVTHRAHLIAAGYSQTRLETAYEVCRSGADGRADAEANPESLLQAHARAFARPALDELPGHPVRRLVMAKEFGAPFSQVLASANSMTRAQTIAALARYKPRGEIRRYLDLDGDSPFIDSAPVRAVTTDGLPLSMP